MPPQLLDLPCEVLNHVLRECHPSDLGRLSQCCSSLNTYIPANHLLHKELYLLHFDRSASLSKEIGPHWKANLQKFTKLLKFLDSTNEKAKRANFNFIAQAICEFLSNATYTDDESRNIDLLAERFDDQSNTTALLSQSSLFARARGETRLRSQSATGQLSAKLHCLFGVPLHSDRPDSNSSEILYAYPYAISKVYDLRNYTTGTLWGPFLDDGKQRVDWEFMEAIMIVLGHNIKTSRECAILCRNLWVDPFLGATANSYICDSLPRLLVTVPRSPVSSQPDSHSDFVDPYNISGTWMRVVCFLDYRDLYDYNFSRIHMSGEPLDAYDTEEATRLIVMHLRATGYDEHENFDDKSVPVVKFIGTTLPVHASWDANTHAVIKGTVRTTQEGEVRWTSFSIFSGEERWRSEGIQVGGINSARGVLGTWFDKGFDRSGPAGPTAFWKLSQDENISKEADGSNLPIFGYNVIQT